VIQPGIYLLHKPLGETSFALVRAAMAEIAASAPKKKLPVCHGGTLDPFADGLLLLLAGQATRLMDWMHPIPKTYVTSVRWGLETDNGDPLGKAVFEGDASKLTPEGLDAALADFLGWQEQVPPATSAKKLGGEPAYKKAHRGETVVLPPSRVYLHSARWLSHELPHHSRLELTCKGGYYVRALARDLGRRLGCGAHLATLTRSAIGPWRDPGLGERIWIQGEALLPWCPSRQLSEDEALRLTRGQPVPKGHVRAPEHPVPPGFPDPQGPIRGLHRGKLVAMLRAENEQLVTFANLRGGL